MKTHFLKIKLLTLIMIFSLFYGCTPQRAVLDSWLNHTKRELVMKWGPPTRVFDNAPDGEILIYARQGYAPGFGGNPGISYWDYKYMYINNDGKIYYWRTQRQSIPPQQIEIYKRRY